MYGVSTIVLFSNCGAMIDVTLCHNLVEGVVAVLFKLHFELHGPIQYALNEPLDYFNITNLPSSLTCVGSDRQGVV